MMLKRYIERTGHCKSINQLNQVHIELEKEMTPKEVERLNAIVNADRFWPVLRRRACYKLFLRTHHDAWRIKRIAHTAEWMQQLDYMMKRSRKRSAEAFGRQQINEHMRLFSAGGRKKSKTLVVCFTGGAQRMMMHTPVFLQFFDAKACDILMIQYPRSPEFKGYYHGLSGMGNSLEDAFESLTKLIPTEPYAKTVSMGTSAGAVVALRCAVYHQWEAALGVGVSSAEDARWKEALGETLGEAVVREVQQNEGRTELHLMYGVDDERDAGASEEWKTLVPEIRLHPVSDGEKEVKHNALFPLVRRGELESFFKEVLISSENERRITQE